jgi:HK97 family phage major capsid protein
MRAVIEAVEDEGRDLSREETKAFDAADRRFRVRDNQIKALEQEHGFGASRLTRSDLYRDTDIPATEDRGIALGPEQRMADWARSKYQPHGSVDESSVSIGRLIRGMATGDWTGADEERALSEGTDSAGGFLTPEVLGSTVIDRVRKKAKVLQAGATVVPLESDKQYFPRLATGVTGGWKAENAAVTVSDPVFERITFVPHTLAVMTYLSYELFDDLTDEGARAIENELVQSISLGVDLAALRGTGTGDQPTGIRNQAGVTIQSLGTNGASPTYAALVNAVAAIQANNLEPNASIYSSRTGKAFANLTDTTNQPLRPPPLIEPLTQLTSNQIPENLTQGSSSLASEIYTAQWDQLLMGIRPRVRVQIKQVNAGDGGFPVNLKASSEWGMANMQLALLAWIRADVQLAHPEAFVVTTGAL